MFAFYSFRLNFGNSMSGTELRGCLFVPAAFTSSRSCVGDRTATENGDWAVQPHWLCLLCVSVTLRPCCEGDKGAGVKYHQPQGPSPTLGTAFPQVHA